MGGSAIAGEIINFWQEVSGMSPTFYAHRDYDLPYWVSKNDLVVCISWSGNTEETLSCYEAAIGLGIPSVSITTGGKLAELSKKHKTPLVLISDKDIPPRMGVGYMTAALFQLVGLGEKITTILPDSIKTESEGKNLADKIGKMTPHQTDPLTAKTGAGLVRGRPRPPLLYSSYKWRILPRLWKILFNENDKIHAFWNYFPGMAHNELVGFADKAQGRFFSVFFKDTDNDRRQNKNIDAAIAILDKQEYNYTIVNISSANNPLETVLSNYILGLWTSFYLAKKLGVDPEKTKLLEEYKKLRY